MARGVLRDTGWKLLGVGRVELGIAEGVGRGSVKFANVTGRSFFWVDLRVAVQSTRRRYA